MSWLQNPLLEFVKRLSTRSRMTHFGVHMHKNVMNERGGGTHCRLMCSVNVFKVSVLPQLLFCNFTAQGVQT